MRKKKREREMRGGNLTPGPFINRISREQDECMRSYCSEIFPQFREQTDGASRQESHQA
jgi:hypothetical protein